MTGRRPCAAAPAMGEVIADAAQPIGMPRVLAKIEAVTGGEPCGAAA